MNAFFSFDIFLVYITSYQNYEIIHADTRYCTRYIWAVDLLLLESHAIINDLDVIVHGFILLSELDG